MSEIQKNSLDPATIALIAKIVSDLLLLVLMKTTDTSSLDDAAKQEFWLKEKSKTDAEVQRLLSLAQS